MRRKIDLEILAKDAALPKAVHIVIRVENEAATYDVFGDPTNTGSCVCLSLSQFGAEGIRSFRSVLDFLKPQFLVLGYRRLEYGYYRLCELS